MRTKKIEKQQQNRKEQFRCYQVQVRTMIKNSRTCENRLYISFTSRSSEFEATLNANEY